MSKNAPWRWLRSVASSAARAGAAPLLPVARKRQVGHQRRLQGRLAGGLTPPGPPALSAGIRYEPALPAARAALIQASPRAPAIKVEVVYPKPFWRSAGAGLHRALLRRLGGPPDGLIHWAGAETSDYWNGYMDGAVRSGERAAGEALASI